MRVLHVAGLLALVAAATTSLVEASPVPSWASQAAVGGARVSSRVEWAATLAGRDGRKVTGSATAKPTPDGTGTEVTVSLAGDTPGATRPWHVHTGNCRQSGGVVGGGRAYTPITIDAEGVGQSRATLAVPLADTGTYYVNIHDAAAAMSIIVACGDLQKR